LFALFYFGNTFMFFFSWNHT